MSTLYPFALSIIDMTFTLINTASPTKGCPLVEAINIDAALSLHTSFHLQHCWRLKI